MSAEIQREDYEVMREPATRFRARLMYDGSSYAGSQYQENAPSVAGVLQGALARRLQP